MTERGMVKVPHMLGLSLEQAETVLMTVGLSLEVEEISDGDPEHRKVVDYTPSAGTEVITGSTVTLKLA